MQKILFSEIIQRVMDEISLKTGAGLPYMGWIDLGNGMSSELHNHAACVA